MAFNIYTVDGHPYSNKTTMVAIPSREYFGYNVMRELFSSLCIMLKVACKQSVFG